MSMIGRAEVSQTIRRSSYTSSRRAFRPAGGSMALMGLACPPQANTSLVSFSVPWKGKRRLSSFACLCTMDTVTLDRPSFEALLKLYVIHERGVQRIKLFADYSSAPDT
jgi:hypothetical protein